MSNKIPLWVKYIVNDLFEVKPGTYKVKGQYAKDKEKKVGFVMWPIRVALSGKQMTPGGATELMEVLGKEESLARIQTAIDRLSQEA